MPQKAYSFGNTLKKKKGHMHDDPQTDSQHYDFIWNFTRCYTEL